MSGIRFFKMRIVCFTIICIQIITNSFLSNMAYAEGVENIIQEEKMSFETCLNVITTSETKLSISPELSDLTKEKRVATFTLSDGTLTITCDGKKGMVTVSTKTN